ncbi:hypothetical protein MRX96_009428 [Rhipicephalus microplus]
MQESSGYGSTSGGGTESGPSSPYPTYYNLDQNRMCTPPDPGPPYGIANFAATGAYRTVLPNMDNNPALRGERTGSGGISVPSSGVYAQPVVNGVNDSDFGSGSSPMAGPPPRSGEFERPYASAGPRGGSPPSDDPMKRRRSLDSTLCNRPSSVGGPGPSAVPSGSGAMDGGGQAQAAQCRKCSRRNERVAARVGPHHATGRRLAGSAAHTSTLSPHYDAVTRDPTWLCAFCLKGSHHQGLGDLYGPYPGTVVRPAEPEPTSSQEETLLRRGRATKRKKSDSFSGTEDGTTPRRGSRQRLSEAEREPEVCKELWVHEACAAWSQGVYLGGNRVHGLQEAVAEAAHLVCCKCKLVGASLGCLSRGCSEKYHYLCAVEKGTLILLLIQSNLVNT